MTERGVSIAQAARDLDVHETMVRTWEEIRKDCEHAFPGKSVIEPEQAEIERLKKEVAKLKMERDILKGSSDVSACSWFSASERHPDATDL